MGRMLTTDEAVQRCIDVHGDKYDYSKVEYTGPRKIIKIVCSSHGSFQQKWGDHVYSKSGCPECARLRVAAASRFSLEKNITRSIDIHGDKYDYSLIEKCKNIKEKVSIICKNCEILFKQSFSQHIHRKNGCPVCYVDIISKKKRLSSEEYLKRITDLYDNKYDYSKVVYRTLHDYIVIICRRCNLEFKQKAHNHLNGHGCRQCNPGGVFLSEKIFQMRPMLRTLPAILYLVKFKNLKESFYKIGISVKSINQRFGRNYNEYEVISIKEIPLPLYEAWEAEQSLHRQLRQYRYIPKTKFGGHTECFTEDILDILLQE